jgi:hypothetical protein
MFDIFVKRPPAPTFNIIQNGVGGSEAAKLHAEIRDLARAEVLSGAIEHYGAHNEFKVAKVRSEYSGLDDLELRRAVFTLNGHEYDIRVQVGSDLRAAVERRVADAITAEILRQLRNQKA